MTRRPAWKRLARDLRDASFRTLSFAERVSFWRPRQIMPPAHLRFYYYRSLARRAYADACDRARIEALYHGLSPDDRVLDVGSGVGNFAVGLADYLHSSYDGVDVHREAVQWCRETITPRYPAFRFHHADLASRAYNAGGRADAAHYRFPFSDRQFDFVFLASVFTHMLPDAVQHYIQEIGRLLPSGGVCVASFFLLNSQTRKPVEEGRSFMPFLVERESGLFRLHDATTPESAVAIDEEFVLRAYRDAGLELRNIRRGNWWSGQADDQDVVSVLKTEDRRP
jgi:SAM-dependent methyltransferase